jgi:hypothetical protein
MLNLKSYSANAAILTKQCVEALPSQAVYHHISMLDRIHNTTLIVVYDCFPGLTKNQTISLRNQNVNIVYV